MKKSVENEQESFYAINSAGFQMYNPFTGRRWVSIAQNLSKWSSDISWDHSVSYKTNYYGVQNRGQKAHRKMGRQQSFRKGKCWLVSFGR